MTTGAVYRRLNRAGTAAIEAKPLSDLPITPAMPEDAAKGFRTDEPMSTLQQVGNYNNFYEFTTDKEGVAAAASGFVSRPWTVAVEGMVHKPKVFDLDEVLRLGPLEERVYRMRCVEGWSMVIPWVGLPLARLLDRVGADGRREVCRLPDPARPHTHSRARRGSVLQWPYVEGLRIDEAMHPLTILAAGLYGRRIAAAERRTAPAGGALEIWVQGDQVDRQDHAHGRPADLDVERPGTVRVRVLLERQPERAAPPMEPGDRAARSVRAVGGRRCSSMDMPIRSANSIPAWTCGSISKPAAMISVGMKRQCP